MGSFDVLYEMSTLDDDLKTQQWNSRFNAETNPQLNGNDCGIFVILNAKLINLNSKPSIDQNVINTQQAREHLAALMIYFLVLV